MSLVLSSMSLIAAVMEEKIPVSCARLMDIYLDDHNVFRNELGWTDEMAFDLLRMPLKTTPKMFDDKYRSMLLKLCKSPTDIARVVKYIPYTHNLNIKTAEMLIDTIVDELVVYALAWTPEDTVLLKKACVGRTYDHFLKTIYAMMFDKCYVDSAKHFVQTRINEFVNP